ncbi:MAG: anti-sigma factor [Solirubrobacteraceae bacterium]|nr:anti-sigma factor [Solirubrobacteraceae bacterium]
MSDERDDVVRRLERLPDEAWDPPAAPPLRIDLGDQAAPAPTRRRLTLRPAFAALAAAVFVGLGVAGGVLLDDDDAGRIEFVPIEGAQKVELAALPGAGAASAIAEMGGNLEDTMLLSTTDLAPSKPGEYYELWALNSPDDLAPIGTFRVGKDGAATVEFPLGVDPAKYKALDISIERDDGDPGHSGDSVLRSA